MVLSKYTQNWKEMKPNVVYCFFPNTLAKLIKFLQSISCKICIKKRDDQHFFPKTHKFDQNHNTATCTIKPITLHILFHNTMKTCSKSLCLCIKVNIQT